VLHFYVLHFYVVHLQRPPGLHEFSVKTAADRHRLAATVTSTADELSGMSTLMTLNDPKI